MAGVSSILRWGFDLPDVVGRLCDNKREWRFRELDERAAGIVGGQKNFPGNFRSATLRPPDRLAVIGFPAGF